MTKSKSVLLSIMLFATILLAACVPDQTAHDIEDTIQNGGAYERDINAELASEENNVNNVKEEVKDEEKLKVLSIYKIDAETLNLEDDSNSIIEEIHNLGGYVSSNEIDKKGTDSSSPIKSKLTLRVPNDKVRDAIEVIKEITSVQSESLNSVDFTDSYYDIEARIEGLNVREERLYELYKETTNIKDIIEIDEKLAEIEEAKEEEIRRKHKIDKRISFSRIDVNLEEVSKLTKVNSSNMTSSEKLSEAFSSAVDLVVGGLAIVIRLIPVIVLIGGGSYIYTNVYPKVKTWLRKKK